MSPLVFYEVLVAAVAAERIVELALSRRNERRARARGGIEHGHRHYRVMVVVHTLFLISCAAEPVLFARPFRPVLGPAAVVVVLLAMSLRYWAIATLGERWNTRVVVVPGERAVAAGPYRFVRHPNYLAVVAEIAALPLVHGAWLTATVFSFANALLLRRRIRVEEEALRSLEGWDREMAGRGALLPRLQ